VAAVWAARAALDAVALFAVAHFVLPGEPQARRAGRPGIGALAVLCAFLAGAWLAASAVADPATRLAALAALTAALVIWEWHALLGREDREHLRQLCNRLLTTPAR
jgi:hypothetical protein